MPWRLRARALPLGRMMDPEFKLLYDGDGALVAPTAWPVLEPAFDRLYTVFPRNRLRITGRPHVCANGRCQVSASP